VTRAPAVRRRVARRGALVAGALAAALGCGEEKPAAVARAADTTSPEGHFAAPAIVPNDTSCVLSGLWRQCSVRERLERAGLAPQVGDTVRHAFLHVPGQRYRVGDAEVQAFVYETTEMRRRDTAPLDSVRAAPPGTDTVWERPPTLITAANLAAVLIGGNERQVERVTLALTAGTGTTDFQPAGAAKR
jgi:hypothetical protein